MKKIKEITEFIKFFLEKNRLGFEYRIIGVTIGWMIDLSV